MKPQAHLFLAAIFGAGLLATPAFAQTAQTPVKVGVILPLTGNTAWGGRPAKIAAEMAAEEVNTQGLAGKYKLNLVFADGACEPRTTYAAAEKLVNQDKVQVLIGEWCSSASVAMAQVAADAKVPTLVQISTADYIAKNAGPYVFQSIMQNREIQEREAELLLQKFKFKTAAILVENNDFGLSFRENISRVFKEKGIKVTLDIPQDRHDTNWYSIITQIQGAKPDIVVASISAGQAANFVKQYAESNMTIPLFFDYPPPPYIFEKQVGEQAGKLGLVRGAFFLKNPDMPPREQAFITKFEPLVEKALGEKHPTVHWDIVTYDAVMLVADALKRSGSVKPDDIAAALVKADYQGVLAKYQFDADRGVKPEGFDFAFIRNTPGGGLEVVK
ncbi:ABC transporter substrate-binding protein [Aquabacter sp. CN5-332]|uniref:ABC transporter substrate-binding protein n=1 Tax=Aquabacter sp. CN5-332 TaxID=3156608 RepID=UPI0032B614E0